MALTIRSYDISKGHCRFAEHERIEFHAGNIYRELADESYLVGRSLNSVVERLAYYYDTINRIQPFPPEGNGRTQRLFIEHLAAVAGYQVDWSSAKSWQIIEVAEQSSLGRLDPTAFMFEEITSPREYDGNWTLNP